MSITRVPKESVVSRQGDLNATRTAAEHSVASSLAICRYRSSLELTTTYGTSRVEGVTFNMAVCTFWTVGTGSTVAITNSFGQTSVNTGTNSYHYQVTDRTEART